MSQESPAWEGLTPEAKRALLARMLRERAGEDRLPLSYGQRALWWLYQTAPTSAAYNIAFAAIARGTLDVAALQHALVAVIERHEVLRATYDVRDGEPAYRIQPAAQTPLEVVDAAAWDPEELRARIGESCQRPFDLEHGPILRACLFSRSAAEHVVLLVVHHIAFDAVSLGVFLTEWTALYEAKRVGSPPALKPLSARYSDFVRWQQGLVSGPDGERMKTYWHDLLQPPLPVIELPVDRVRPRVQSFRGGTHAFSIDDTLATRLRALAREEGATLFMVLLAAFQVLLRRYTGQEDLLIGSFTAGRSHWDFEGIVGYFVNPVVMRGDLSGDPSFTELLGRTRRAVVGALAAADYPFPLLVQHLHPVRDPSRSPLFQVVFNLIRHLGAASGTGMDRLVPSPGFGGVRLEAFPLPQQEGQFDLTLDVIDLDGPLLVNLKYSTDLFEAETIERMAGHLQALLRGIVSGPMARIADLPLLTGAERESFSGWNATGCDLPARCVHELLSERALAVPDRVAVEGEAGRLTFGELEGRAERLAAVLRSHGVGPGSRVGVYMERGPDLLAALLGVWKAGGAYVPLDPGFPAERLAYMVEDAGVVLLLTQGGLEDSLPTPSAAAIAVDKVVGRSEGGPASGSGGPRAHPEDLAYVIYTSGSTGRPKGVAITHRALLNLLLSMRREPGLAESDVLLSVTTLSFDIAALELYLPLLVGARVYVASREDALDGRRLAGLLEQTHATVMQATPAMWRMLIESGWSGSPRLKVLCGGEALPRDLAEALLKRAGEVWNVYGPTETTVWSSVERVESGAEPVLIGRPIANTQMWVLDDGLQACPVGVTGELYIGGTGLARGYWDRPDLTAEKFVPDPFSREEGARLYRTGDLARRLPDGRLECLGRIDHQVKVRGFRIELGEIEAALREHEGVEGAVVLAQEGAAGDRRLCAYLTSGLAGPASVTDLRESLRRTLPVYMVPSSFVFVDRFPLTPNGKVDRRSLAGYGGPRGEEERLPPRTETEKLVADVWRELLGVETVGVRDNFFDLGGHSLLAARALSRIEARVGRRVELTEIIYQTLEQLASSLDARSTLAQEPESSTKGGFGARVREWFGRGRGEADGRPA